MQTPFCDADVAKFTVMLQHRIIHLDVERQKEFSIVDTFPVDIIESCLKKAKQT
jgi:hypothetical protein